MLSPTATDAKQLIPLLAPDWDELDDEPRDIVKALALELMEKSFEIYNSKAKFATVGQMFWTEADGNLKSWDPKAEKLCIGWFPTETQAKNAAAELYGSQAAKERFRTWVLPIWHGTTGAWRKARKEAIQAELEVVAPPTQAERLSALVTQAHTDQPRCGRLVPNDDGDFVPCIRLVDHPGQCFSEVPSMNGSE